MGDSETIGDDSEIIGLVESDRDPDSFTGDSVNRAIDSMRTKFCDLRKKYDNLQGRFNNLQDKYASLANQYQDFINDYNRRNDKWRRMVKANLGPKVYSSMEKLDTIGDRNTLAQVIGSEDIYEWSDEGGWRKAEGVDGPR